MIPEEEFDKLRAQTEKAYLSKIKIEKMALIVWTLTVLIFLGIYLYGYSKSRAD